MRGLWGMVRDEMSEELKAAIIVLSAGGGLLITAISLVVMIMKLVRGWIDKALAKHQYFEHVLDQGSGETVKSRLIRCDLNCPVIHPGRSSSKHSVSPGRYEHVRGR